MKAAVVTGYGPPESVEIRDLPKPEAGPGEVVIRVRAASVSSGDWRIRSMDLPAGFGVIARPMFGFARPRRPVLGTECSGTVDSVGAGVSRWRPGQAVVAFPDVAMGAHAEFLKMPAEGKLIDKPAALNWQEAAAMCFGGVTALHFLRDLGALREGERLLVIGASGSVGDAAVQIGRAMGAHVTAVTSAGNAEMVRRQGAQAVIDYKTQDFAATGERWDVILDCVGTTDYGHARAALSPGGRLLLVSGGMGQMLATLWAGRLHGHRVRGGAASSTPADMSYLAQLAESGRYRPAIDSALPFDQIVAAHRRVESRRKRGAVVVTFPELAAPRPKPARKAGGAAA